MPLLEAKDREFLRNKFEADLKDEVRITFFTQHESGLMVPGLECPGCKDARQLLEEVVSLSPKLRLETLDFLVQEDQAKAMGVDRIPATVVHGGNGVCLRFYGVPSGYEFATLVEDMISVSKADPGLSPKMLDLLGQVVKPTHIQVFVTPT